MSKLKRSYYLQFPKIELVSFLIRTGPRMQKTRLWIYRYVDWKRRKVFKIFSRKSADSKKRSDTVLREAISHRRVSWKRATRPEPFFITTPYFTVTWIVKHRNDDGNKAITYDGNNASMSREKNDKKRPHLSSSRTPTRSCLLLLLSITFLPIRILSLVSLDR